MITSVTVKGWKSFRSVIDFNLCPINILIGQNGAGKSNLISLFRLLSYGYAGDGIQFFVRSQGGANALLHEGAQHTREIEFELCFDVDNGRDQYRTRLVYAASDPLFFGEERLKYTKIGEKERSWRDFGVGQLELRLRADADSGNKTSRAVLRLLQRCNAVAISQYII